MAEIPEQVPSEDGNSFLDDELEALSSIYINETDVYQENEATVISIDLHPSTADNLEEQYVKLTLKLTVKSGYPDVIPEIDIRNPRGLSDDKLSSITKDLLNIAEDKKGNSMLFEIIEAAKDYLTAGNRPCEECAICLYGFHEDDVFTKTECYHYFHSSCLARYAKNSSMIDEDSNSDDSSKNELLCPVCRLPINFDGIDDSFPSPVKGDDEFSVTDTILETQKKLQELYIKQMEKGGIIDLEAEKNKYLIEISHLPSVLDAASEVRSEENLNVKVPQEKDDTVSTSPDNAKNDKVSSHKFSSSNLEQPDRKYTKHREERRGNYGPRPYYGNDYRQERYQSNRGSNGYRRDLRGGRNSYDRRYDSYNNVQSERYNGGYNRNRFSNSRRNNWSENQHKSNQYERHEKYDERNSQRYEKNDCYSERNSQRYARSDQYEDSSSCRYDNSKGQKKKQHDSEDGICCDVENNASNEIDQKSDVEGGDNEVEEMDKVSNEKRNGYHDDYRKVNNNGGYRNNQYKDRRENRYERRFVKYDNNKRNSRFEDSRHKQYDRRSDRFDSRKYNEPNESRRNAAVRPNKVNETNQKKYLNQENEDEDSKFVKENKSNDENIGTVVKKRENSITLHETEEGENLVESENQTELEANSALLSKDQILPQDFEVKSENRSEAKSSLGHNHNFSTRNSDARRKNGSKNYNRHYQRSNSNGDRYNSTNRYSKQSNYYAERKKYQSNFRKNTADLDEDEIPNAMKSDEAIAKDVCESSESSLKDNQVYNNLESEDFSDTQHSRKISVRTDAENTNHHKNHREGRQGYNHRYQNNNKNYRETRPFRNNPRYRNYQNDFSDRTSNDSKKCSLQKDGSDSSHNIPLTENDTDIKHETVPNESVEFVPVKASNKEPTQVSPKESKVEKSVPTSNFLPPMSSVAPPPGFQNPTRKIVYGLAAANAPPGFNRS